MTVTRLYWVRHGPTHQKCMTGWRDVPADLSDTAQIARLNAYLPEKAVLISSDLIRARATADCLNTGRKRLPDEPQLRELNFGDWDGQSFDAVAASHPDLSRAYWETPGDVIPPNGESWNTARARVDAAVDALLTDHVGQNLIIVAHVGVILGQVGRAGQMPAAQALGHKIDNLSVTEITHSPAGWALGVINHLP